MSNNGLFSAFLKVLVAAVNPFAGGNSRLARSLRARAQPRDKKGRWVETGQGFSLNIGLPSGRVVDVATRSFGAGASENTVQVYFPDGDAEIPAGFYEVPSGVGDASKGYIPGSASYVDKPGAIKDVVQLSSLQRKDAPDGWELNEDGSYETIDGDFKIARNAERTGWTLSQGGEEVKTEKELSLAFKEAARRDIEGVSTDNSREKIARLRDNVEQVRLREGASEVEIQEAQRKLDRILFDDPDLSDEEKADRLELLDESEIVEESKVGTDYRGQHEAPSRDDDVGSSLDKIDETFPPDILDPRSQAQLYSTGFPEADKESFDVINKVKGNPDAEVTIYRAVPDSVEGINAGDWVSLSPAYAQQHLESNLNGRGKIVSKNVKASEVFTDANSINEWGYSPESKDAKAPRGPKNPNSLGESVTISDEDSENMANSRYTGPHYDKETKTFTPERQALHDRIIKQLLKKYGATAVAFAVQYMKGGGPGSGKSSLTDLLLGYDPNHIVIDPDEIKALFPEVRAALKRLNAGVGTKGDEEWASESHEESSYLAKRLHRAAVERNLNVVVDGTGDSGINSIRNKVKEARDNGYDRVVADYLYLEPEEGVRRAELRQKETFRKVPTDVIADTYGKIAKVFPEILENNLFDEIRVYDNNVERGEAPKLIFEAKDGELVSLNEDNYDSFLKSASKAEKIAEDFKKKNAKTIEDDKSCRDGSDSTTFANKKVPDDATCDLLKDHVVLKNERLLYGKTLYKRSVRLGADPEPLSPFEKEIIDEYLASTITKTQDTAPEDSDSTSGGDDGRGADDSGAGPVEVGEVDAEDGESAAEQKVAESADSVERLYPELQSREAEIDRSRLSTKVQKAFDNLLIYKQRSLDAMRRVAYDVVGSDREKQFDFQYAIASRVAQAINELADAYSGGDATLASFFSGAEDARIENMRIIPSSIKTVVGTDPLLPEGQSVVSEAEAIIITKAGRPMLLTWNSYTSSGYKGARAYIIKDDGTVDRSQIIGSISAEPNIAERGSHPTAIEPDRPHPASIGMAKVHDASRYDLYPGLPSAQNEGIGGYLIFMSRWAAQKSGRIFEHSNTLYAPGNFYSKRVSNRIEFHHRQQREKFVFERFGGLKNPLFEAMDNLGWLTTGFKTELKKDTQEGSVNVGPLDQKFNSSMLSSNGIASLVRKVFHGKDAIPGEDYPAFFEKHVTGDKEDWAEFDVQSFLLRTTFKDGLSKDEAVAKLRSMATELRKFAETDLFTPGDPRYPSGAYYASSMKGYITSYSFNLEALADALGAVDDAPEGFRVDEPKYFDENEIKFFESPFTSRFTNFTVPEGVKPVDVSPFFVERVFNFANLSPDELADVPEWAKSENPALLAQNLEYEELAGALRTAVVDNKDGSMVSLTKDGFTQEFQGSAIYRAIENMQYKASLILAEMYDSVSGSRENQDSYDAWLKTQRDASSALNRLQAEITGNMAEPTNFDNIEGGFSESNGILFSGLKLRSGVADESSLPPEQRLSTLSQNNIEFSFNNDAGSRVSIPRQAYVPVRSVDDWIRNGISDNPKIIARNFNPDGLKRAFSVSISSGKTSVRLRYPNNKLIDVPLEAVRDTLQYQGVDTNELLVLPELTRFRIRELIPNTSPAAQVSIGGFLEDVVDVGSGRGQLVIRSLDTGVLAPPRPPGAADVSLAMRVGDEDISFADVSGFTDEDGVARFRVRYVHPGLVGSEGLDGADEDVREQTFDTLPSAIANLRATVLGDLFLERGGLHPLRNQTRYDDRELADFPDFREVSVSENPNASGDTPVRERVLSFGGLQTRSLRIREYANGSAEYVVEQIDADGGKFEVVVGRVEPSSIEVNGLSRDVYKSLALTTAYGSSSQVNRFFTSKEQALDVLGARVGSIFRSVKNINNLGQSAQNVVDKIANIPQDSSVLEGASFVSDRSGTSGSGIAVMGNGQIGEFSSLLNLERRPAYRVDDAEFVYADFSVFVDGAVSYSGQVTRAGRSRWHAVIRKDGQAVAGGNMSFSGIENYDKALSFLKTKAAERLGLSSDDLERMFPAGERVPEPEAPAPAPAVASLLNPVGNLPNDGNDYRLAEDISGLDEAGMLERVNEASLALNSSSLSSSENLSALYSDELATRLQALGFEDVELDDYGSRVNFVSPDGISGSIRVTVGPNSISFVRERSLAHQIYNVLGVPAYSGGQITSPEGDLVAFDLPENTDNGGALSLPLFQAYGNRPDDRAREQELNWFNMSQDAPELAQARKDLQRSRVLQMLLGSNDHFGNKPLHQLIRDDEGNFRVALADGMYMFDHRNSAREHISSLYSESFRNALDSGNFDSVSAERFGNTSPQELKEIVAELVAPLTPNVIRRLVVNNVDSNSVKTISATLIERRREMLELFGVADPSGPEAVAVAPTPDASASPTPESTPIPVPDLGEGTVLLNSSEFTLPNDARIAVAHYENELGALKVVYDSEGRQVARVEFVNAFNGDVRARIYPGDVGSATDNGRAREVILSRDAFPDLTPEQIFSLAANWTSVEFSGRGDLGFKYLFDEGAESFADLPNFDSSYEELFRSAGISSARGENLNLAGDGTRRNLQIMLDKRNVDEQKREMYQRAIDANDLNANAVSILYSRLRREPASLPSAPKKGGAVASPSSASDLDSQRNVNETRRVRVSDLKPGDYIAGNGEVLFVSSPLRRPYNEVNVHLVDANGQARIWQVNLDGIVPVLNVNPPEEFSGEPNPVVAFRNEGNKTLDDLKAEYPGHRVLPNGDVLLAQRDYQEKSRLRRTFRFEVVVHRTEAEEFVAYARRYEIDPVTGEKIGPSESAALQAPAHSSVALINRSEDLINILKPEKDGGRKNPASWFSNKRPEPEVIDPRTGMPLPVSLIPSRAEGEIPGTGINKTGDGLKDALISYISSLVDRGLPADSIIARLARQKDSEGNSVFSDDELVDLVDRVQFAKRFPLQPIPYVSRDGKTLIKPGDRVKHYDAQGNYLKSGTVMSRVGVKPYRKPNGTYEYRDLLLVKVDGGRTYELVARRLEVIDADGGGEGSSKDNPSDAGSLDGVPFIPEFMEDSGDTAFYISEPNPPKTLYHVAPKEARENILANGLDPKGRTWNVGLGQVGENDVFRDEHLWTKDDEGNEYAYEYRPIGIYMFEDLEAAKRYASGGDQDIYEINTEQNNREIIRDPSNASNWDELLPEEKAYVTRVVGPNALKLIDSDDDGGGSSGGLTPAEEQERQNELDKIDPMSDVNDTLETSETYEVNITKARLELIKSYVSLARDAQSERWGDEVADSYVDDPKRIEAFNRLGELIQPMTNGRKIRLTPREMWILNNELEELNTYFQEAIDDENITDEERVAFRVQKKFLESNYQIRRNLGLTVNNEEFDGASKRIKKKYNEIVEQRQAKGGSSNAQAPTPARSPLAPPPPPTISEASEAPEVVRPDSIQVPQGYRLDTFGNDDGFLVAPNSDDERGKPSAIISVDPFYRLGAVGGPVQVRVWAEDDDRFSGDSPIITQSFQDFEDARQWMNARLDNDPRNIADVERAEEPFTPDGYVVKQDPSNPNGYIISLKDEENRDSAYRAYFYKDRYGLYVAEVRKPGERYPKHLLKIRGDLTTVEQELERRMERLDAEAPAGFRSERDSVDGSTLFLPKNSDDLRSPSGKIYMEGSQNYLASLWFQEGSRKNNDDPDNTASFFSFDEAKEWLSGELERMSTWSALPSNIEISEVTKNTKSYRDPTSVNPGFATVEQLSSEGNRFGVSFWNSEADAQSRLYRSPDESPDPFDSLADAEAYIAVKFGPRSESLDDFKDVIPYLSDNETALLKTYPDGELSDRALAMLKLKREVLTRGWSGRMGFHDNSHIGDISFARLADGTEIVIKKFDSTEGIRYHEDNAQTELMASRLFEALDIDSVVMTEFELDDRATVIYIKQPGVTGSYSPTISTTRDLLQYPEAKNIALHDFLVSATDRHEENWLYDGSTNNVRLYPIDHGHPYTMTEVGDTTLREALNPSIMGSKGLFRRMINNFVIANASPKAQDRRNMGDFKDLFSREELESANQKLLGLREMYESMGYGDYFENYILPRMNLLLGVAPS